MNARTEGPLAFVADHMDGSIPCQAPPRRGKGMRRHGFSRCSRGVSALPRPRYGRGMQTATITALGHLGDGVADTPGGPVHVPFALPGEVVRGIIADGRMDGAEVIEPSPDRVAPPCPQFGVCGGCTVQHGSDAFVARWKADLVVRALAARGLGAEIAGVETSPPLSRRRAVLAARRTRDGVAVGFHARGSDRIVAIDGCRVLHPRLADARAVIGTLAARGGLLPGVLRAQVTLTDTGLDIDVTGGRPLDAVLRVDLAAIAAVPDIARLTWAGELVVQARAPRVRFGRAAVTPPPAAFLQPTAEGEAALVAAVRRTLGPARRIVDLFAGCGTFTLPLAEVAEVRAVEGEAAMLAALDQGWRRAEGLRRVVTETRDLFRRPLLPPEVKGVEAVVLDPPRAGARDQVRALGTTQVPRIAYVSCNPASFARDARILVDAGYRMGPVTVVDQFRWSAHVELVAPFTR